MIWLFCQGVSGYDLRRIRSRLRTAKRSFGLHTSKAIAIADKRWLNGSTIKICFLEGSNEEISLVKEVAMQWVEHANLTFEFVDSIIGSDIRVSFDTDDGAWSYVGTDNLNIPKANATLNLGWVDEHVILHEFGHMIGLSHEHQNPKGGINWNEKVVITELALSPNFWDEDEVRQNVLQKYSMDILVGTAFDPKSIMLYSFSSEWTTDGFKAEENKTLSREDKDFVKSKKMYPPQEESFEYTQLFLGETISASISKDGEEDVYRFIVKEDGVYSIKTKGSLDMYMHLYEVSTKKLIAEDDDSGSELNAMIEIELERGEYYVHLKHFNSDEQGDYEILVVK